MKDRLDRRDFVRTVAAATALGAVSPGAHSAMQTSDRPARFDTIAFDAYGTLFDVFSVTSLCEQLFPGQGNALAQLWRAKQLQYSLLTSLMGRFQDFWQLTDRGLVYAAKSLRLDLTGDKRDRLMDAYLRLSAFSDVKPGLEALKARGLKLAILSNGEPRMLQAAVTSAGLRLLLDQIISVNDVGVFKPSPRVYALVGQKLQTAPNRLGFVSSNSWDVTGAGAAGLYTFWLQRNAGEPQEELGFPANRVIAALTELEVLVR
jgi:2-haloacid dehalogenase